MKTIKNNKGRILICVNEFFGAWGTPYGGYGFVARHLLSNFLNKAKLNFDVCLGRSKNCSLKKYFFMDQYITEEGVKLIRLPRVRALAANIVNSYDLIISIEATVDFVFSLKGRIKKPILFWIQDPRCKSDWEQIDSVQLAKEPVYWNDNTYKLVKECNSLGLIKFVTQAHFLSEKAKELYSLPNDTQIKFLPNPINVDWNLSDFSSTKENTIIFLGRLDSVKRGWLYCEIAKNLPQYNFLVLGDSSDDNERSKNKILKDYYNLKNLHFLGRVVGKEKDKILRKAKILVNTSIHEALPVSFLEAFSYGLCVVSNQNPDNLTDKYGIYIGQSLGDGFEDVDKFIQAIVLLLSNDKLFKDKSNAAYQYVSNVHSIDNFGKLFLNAVDM